MEKRTADDSEHHHFWSMGRDKGRGKPLPLKKRNVGNVGNVGKGPEATSRPPVARGWWD